MYREEKAISSGRERREKKPFPSWRAKKEAPEKEAVKKEEGCLTSLRREKKKFDGQN